MKAVSKSVLMSLVLLLVGLMAHATTSQADAETPSPAAVSSAVSGLQDGSAIPDGPAVATKYSVYKKKNDRDRWTFDSYQVGESNADNRVISLIAQGWTAQYVKSLGQ
jgi:hypothetical protein